MQTPHQIYIFIYKEEQISEKHTRSKGTRQRTGPVRSSANQAEKAVSGSQSVVLREPATSCTTIGRGGVALPEDTQGRHRSEEDTQPTRAIVMVVLGILVADSSQNPSSETSQITQQADHEANISLFYFFSFSLSATASIPKRMSRS